MMAVERTPRGNSRRPSDKSGSPFDGSNTVRLTYDRATRRYLMELEAQSRSPRTLSWYTQKLDQLGRALDIDQLEDLTRDRLLDFLMDMQDRKRSPAYIRGWHQVFHGFIGWAREQGYAVHPSLINERARAWFTIKKPQEVEAQTTVYSRDDLERIYDACASKRDEVLCKLLAGTGLRLSEALGLTLDDLQGDQIRVRSGKGRKFRWVPTTSGLRRELDRYIERVRKDGRTEHLFLSIHGEPLSVTAAGGVMRRLSRATGLHVHAHAFRHTYATEYLRGGGESERLRRILGHTTHRLIARYVHLAGADLGRNIDELSPY